MKTIIVLIQLLLVGNGLAYAQLFTKEERVTKAKNETYRVTDIDNGSIIRTNKSEFKDTKLSYGPDLDMSGLDIRQTSKQIFAQVIKAFPEERRRELAQKNESLGLKLFVLPNGKVKEIEFYAAKNRSMTLSEIETLDEAIRKNVIVPVTKPALYKSIPFLVFLSQPIRFTKL